MNKNLNEKRLLLRSALQKAAKDISKTIEPDVKFKQEQKDLEVEKLKNDLEKQKLENRNLRQKIYIRKYLSWGIFGFLFLWSATIFILLFLIGCNKITLSDKVIITLISTTTINIIGLFLVVVKYFFSPNQ